MDTFVLRTSDSGIDTITDFTDGTDVIGLDLPSGSDFNDLEIEQVGANTNVSYGGITELILTNFTAFDLSILDFASTSIVPLTLTGTTENDALIGGSGGDIITTNSGDDQVYSRSGDDAITIDGVGNKTINGGSGTDSLAINVPGHSSLYDYAITFSEGQTTLTSRITGDVISY